MNDLKVIIRELLRLVYENVIEFDSPELLVYFCLVACVQKQDHRSIRKLETLFPCPIILAKLWELSHIWINVVLLEVAIDSADNSTIRPRKMLPAVEHDTP